MLIAICAKISKPGDLETTKQVIAFFQNRSVNVTVEKSMDKHFDLPTFDEFALPKADTLITLGGDGSILRAAHKYSSLKAPMLGINLGSLGFMADVPENNINDCLLDLLEGNYSVEKRLVLEASLNEDIPFSAYNDVVLHRAANASLISLGVFIDDKLLTVFKADGLIFATPGGSTAYSLAAGGPIIAPKVEGYVLTPICAHTISNRPIVMHPEDSVCIKVMKPVDSPIEVINDGYGKRFLKEGDCLKLSQSSQTFDLIKLAGINYFSTLSTKLGWSGSTK